MSNKYDDIINLPHYVSKKYPQMSLESRAMQFASFSALTGFEYEIEETSRLTDKRLDLDEDEQKVLDHKLQIIQKNLCKKPIITFTYFIPDLKKDGGKYVTISGPIKKIDEYKKIIVLEDNSTIPINEIINILLN